MLIACTKRLRRRSLRAHRWCIHGMAAMCVNVCGSLPVHMCIRACACVYHISLSLTHWQVGHLKNSEEPTQVLEAMVPPVCWCIAEVSLLARALTIWLYILNVELKWFSTIVQFSGLDERVFDGVIAYQQHSIYAESATLINLIYLDTKRFRWLWLNSVMGEGHDLYV